MCLFSWLVKKSFCLQVVRPQNYCMPTSLSLSAVGHCYARDQLYITDPNKHANWESSGIARLSTFCKTKRQKNQQTSTKISEAAITTQGDHHVLRTNHESTGETQIQRHAHSLPRDHIR